MSDGVVVRSRQFQDQKMDRQFPGGLFSSGEDFKIICAITKTFYSAQCSEPWRGRLVTQSRFTASLFLPVMFS
jgi:hypothetical protein